jgi:Meckel syndrome type 1 protein
VISGVAVTIADARPTQVQVAPLPANPVAPAIPASPVAASPATTQTLPLAAPIALADAPAPQIRAALLPVVPVLSPKPARAEASTPAPREYALSIRQPASLVSPSPAIEGKSAAPGGQGDLGHGQPPMADPSLTSPAGPSPVVSPEATRGPATLPVQQIAPLATPLPQPVAVAPAAHDMGALVDRLVEARAAARSAASPMTVTTAVRHAEFGSVSLRFDTAGDRLSVTMASNDPGFAPAAQAALASQVAPATTADTTGQQNPQRQHAPDQPSAFQSGNATTGGFAQNQQQPQGQQAQPGFAAATRQPARPGNPSTGAETAADPSTHQSGVFA